PTPDAAQTKLIGEKRRAQLNSLTVDAANSSQIIAEQIIPESEGGFWIREIGLYDADGVLIAVANCPETYKPQLAEGSGRTQTVRMILIVSSTSAVTLKIDPAVVLATRKYVDDKVLEVRQYADALMAEHVKAADPHTQYLLKKQLSSATDSDSDTQAATPKAVKAVSSGRLLAVKSYVTTSTHQLTTGTKKVRIRAWSAGGGGGGSATSGAAAASGGAGGYLEGVYDVSSLTSLALVVGIGGAAVAAGTAGNGGNGGATTIAALGISITGGTGGVYAGSTQQGGGLGGVPSVTTAGTLAKITGQSGQGAVGALGGVGGSVYGSYGGLPHYSSAGDDGCLPAGGGAGASYTTNNPKASGAGGNGMIIIEEFA
ncbi:phage tail protein, partial [Pantoea sp. M_5]|uniref:phage tail protein n=2 Tax=unclassified Pantoea TaxID=2630326 RepID=UPI001CC20807